MIPKTPWREKMGYMRIREGASCEITLYIRRACSMRLWESICLILYEGRPLDTVSGLSPTSSAANTLRHSKSQNGTWPPSPPQSARKHLGSLIRPAGPPVPPTYSICRVLAICTVRCLGKPGCNPSPAICGGVISADPLRPPNPSPALRDTGPKDQLVQRQRQRPSWCLALALRF